MEHSGRKAEVYREGAHEPVPALPDYYADHILRQDTPSAKAQVRSVATLSCAVEINLGSYVSSRLRQIPQQSFLASRLSA